MDTSGLDTSKVPSVEGYVQNQFASEDPYVSAIVNKYQTAEKPLDIYTRLENEAGIPQLKTTASTLMKEVGNVEDILGTIEPDVAARTRESLVTEAQRRGLVQSKQAPWLEKLGKLGTGLGRVMEGLGLARQDVGTKTSLAMEGLQQELKPLEFAYSVKMDRNARSLTGFTTDRQTQLDVLMDKLQRQRTLDDREWEQANKLAAEEREYKRTLQTTAANAGVKISGSESINDLLKNIGTSGSNWDFNDFDSFMGW